MTLISLVYARSRNGVIGADGGLPWHIPSDLKRFKATTLGKPIVMGRKTWESLPRKPLPGRLNIVLTRRRDFAADGAVVVHDVGQALLAAGDAPEVCIIGGGEIYALFFRLAGRIYETVVDVDVAGDTFAPALDSADWIETDVAAGERGAIAYGIEETSSALRAASPEEKRLIEGFPSMPTKSQKTLDISQRVPSPLGKVPSECEADEVPLAATRDTRAAERGPNDTASFVTRVFERKR